jgi:hypothetical protein
VSGCALISPISRDPFVVAISPLVRARRSSRSCEWLPGKPSTRPSSTGRRAAPPTSQACWHGQARASSVRGLVLVSIWISQLTCYSCRNLSVHHSSRARRQRRLPSGRPPLDSLHAFPFLPPPQRLCPLHLHLVPQTRYRLLLQRTRVSASLLSHPLDGKGKGEG